MNGKERKEKYLRQIDSLQRLAHDRAATQGEKEAALRMVERLRNVDDRFHV